MTNAVKYLLSSIAAAILLIVSALYLMGPVILRVPNIDSIRGEPLFTLFNPLRDVSSERVAGSFLSQLRDGKCDVATVRLPTEKAASVCERQIKYPLEKWKLVDREDKSDQIELHYFHWSGNLERSEEMWASVTTVDGEMAVTEFAIIY